MCFYTRIDTSQGQTGFKMAAVTWSCKATTVYALENGESCISANQMHHHTEHLSELTGLAQQVCVSMENFPSKLKVDWNLTFSIII